MILIDMIKEYEKQFKINDYYGRKIGGIYRYKKGDIPIMISAPHSVNQIRNGNLKIVDSYTGGITLALQEMTKCHAMYRTHTSNGDANHDLNCSYKKELIKKIVKNDIKYLIDIHGMRRDRPHDIDVGTLNGLTTDWLTETLIVDKFNIHGIEDVRFNYIFDATSQGTVTKTVYNKLGITCFQLELNERYRDTEEPLNLVSVVNSIKYIILYLDQLAQGKENIIYNIEK